MIEFIESTHTYLLDGIVVQSVTQLLKEKLFSDMYEGVPEYILKRAGDFGNNVHYAVETDDTEGLSFTEQVAYDQWLKLKRKHNILPLEHETIVHYKDIFIGRLDMVAKNQNKLAINDVKTTYKLQEEYLSWQLSLYKIAYEWMNKTTIDELNCIWLPKKEIGKFIPIEIKHENEIAERLGITL